MRLRARISLLMLMLYMVAMVVPSLSSLLCTCSRHSLQSACCSVSHCSHCDEHHNHSLLHVESPCSCNHSHDTETTLYTISSQQDRELVRVAVIDLIDIILAQELTDPLSECSLERIYFQTPIPRGESLAQPWALRAPPILA